MELNELNKNARGGTELMAARIESALDKDLLDQVQIIHSRVREIDESKKQILVLHDLPQDPEVQHLKDGGWKKYHKLIFVSNWQQAMYKAYLGVPYSAGFVIPNAVEAFEEHEKPNPNDTLRLMYFSTPHRGLDVLYHVFNQLSQEHENLELNVFSSFDLYGWGERDSEYKSLFEALEAHPKINYSKSVSNEQIREEIKRSHILAYPSTWAETSCLVLIESMMGGLIPVHSSCGALPETSLGLTEMYDFTENPNEHAIRLYSMLTNVINAYRHPEGIKLINQAKERMVSLATRKYSWELRANDWNRMIRAILTEPVVPDTVQH